MWIRGLNRNLRRGGAQLTLIQRAISLLLAESGDELFTESGDYIVLE